MKKLYIIISALLMFSPATQTFAKDYISAAPKPSAQASPKKQSDERIRSADKLNSINNKINLYQGGPNPGDEIKSQRYIMEKNKETFKRK